MQGFVCRVESWSRNYWGVIYIRSRTGRKTGREDFCSSPIWKFFQPTRENLAGWGEFCPNLFAHGLLKWFHNFPLLVEVVPNCSPKFNIQVRLKFFIYFLSISFATSKTIEHVFEYLWLNVLIFYLRGEQALRTYLAICFSLAVGNVLNTLHRKQDTWKTLLGNIF